MNCISINKIDFTLSYENVKNNIERLRENYSNNGFDIVIDYKEFNTRKQKTLIEISFADDTNSSDTFSIFAEKEKDNLHFYSFELKNCTDGFYNDNIYNFEDLIQNQSKYNLTCFVPEVLKTLCSLANGSLVLISPDLNSLQSIIAIEEGKAISDVELCVYSSKTNTYYKKSENVERIESDNNKFEINTPIGEWLNDHQDLKQQIQGLPLNEKMNFIGKFLINEKMNGNIPKDEFEDQFKQIKLFGIDNPTLLMIYNLLFE